MNVVKKVRNRVFPVLLAIIMAFSMMPTAVFGADGDAAASNAAQFSDMPDNWSTKALQNAVSNSLLGGADGKIMPDQNLTRAQMAAVITRAFGSTVKGDISGFADVKPADWFSDSLAKAYQMGVIKGSGSQMNPNSAITRQEVFVILARAFKLQPADTMNKAFGDTDKIAGWAKGEVAAFVNAGYIQGSNGKLNPTSLITRAEFAQIFDNLIKQYISTAGEYDQVAEGNIMINIPAVSLKNLKVTGDLVIGDGVGDGEVTLDGVTVTGRLVVRGGGENSIIIKGSSSVSNVVVARVDGAVSVKVQGDAKVEVVYVDDGSDDVSFQGTFGEIEVAAPEIVVKAVGATINNIAVAGEGSKIVVDGTSKVASATLQAPNIQISGTGTVTKVEAQTGSTGSKIETPNTQISVGAGVTGVTGGGGTKVEPGTTKNNSSDGKGVVDPTAQPPSGGGGGGGGNGDPVPSVTLSDVDVTGQTTLTFNCNVAGAAIKWNGTQLSGTTVSGKNTITVSPAAFGSVNTLEISKSGYMTYSNATVVRELVSSPAEFAAAMATTAASIKLGADLTLTTSTMAITRAVSINGNGHSVNKTVVITADNVTIKNLKGTVTTKSQHGISGIGSNTAFYISAKGVVLDGVTVDGSNYPATAPSIGVIGYDASEFTVKNSSFSNMLTGIFSHIGYTLKHPNKFTATGNTFDNITAGIGGTQYTSVTITGNTFKSVKPGGEGIGLGEGVTVIDSTAEAAVSWLETKNTFNFAANAEDKVRDYRLINTTEVKDATHISLTSLYDNLTFKIGADNYTVTPVASGNSTYPYRYDITLTADKALNFGRNIVTAVQSGVLESKIVAYYDLAKFIKNAKDNDVIELQAGTYSLSEQLNIEKAITIRGVGSVTIKAGAYTWSTDNSKKHLVTVYAGTSASPVRLENITFDAAGVSCGLNTYGNAYCKLKGVTIKNSRNAALIVNGSAVDADNLNTANNVWGAVNVDPGSGVKTASVFTLTGSGILSEFKQIWSDGKYVEVADPAATVTVNAPTDYKEYRYIVSSKETNTLWVKGLKDAAVVKDDKDVSWIYPNLRDAVAAAKIVTGKTVLVMPGTYNITGTALDISGSVTVEGADKASAIIKGARDTGTTVSLSSGAALKNLTVTRDNSGDWATNANNTLVAFGTKLSADTTLENCIITQGRNGVYLNNSYATGSAIIKGNKIYDNRTGINFANNCNNMQVIGNEITGNWTIGMVHYTTAASDLSSILLKANTIKGNWVGQIFIKSGNPWDTTTGLVTGNLDLAGNDFGGTSAGGIQTVTVAEKYNYAHAEPGYNDQQPASVGGTAVKPGWTPPTVRIYGYSTAGIAGANTQKYTDTPSGSVNAASENDLRSALIDDTVTTINLTADISINSILKVNYPVTINGAGHTITVAKSLGTDNSSKHAMTIYADDVTVKNLTIDSSKWAFGAQAYEAVNVELNDVTLLNSTGAGLTVNGSEVTANNLNTSGNAWGGVNVDPGSGVTEPSVFTLTGNGALAEAVQIWSDGAHVTGTATVTVNADGYTKNSGKVGYYWTKVAPPTEISVVSITGLVAPVTDAAPITSGALTTTDTTYKITSLTWDPPVTTTFAGVTTYTATIVLTAEGGYKFPTAGLTPIVNEGAADAGTTSGGDVKGNQLTFIVRFDPTL